MAMLQQKVHQSAGEDKPFEINSCISCHDFFIMVAYTNIGTNVVSLRNRLNFKKERKTKCKLKTNPITSDTKII